MTLNLPNVLTLLRLVLVPPLVFALLTNEAAIALGILAAAALTEAADGLLARHFRQVTPFGTRLDPIVDKVLLVSVYLCLAMLDATPVWLVVLVIARDGMIVGGIGLMRAMGRRATIRPLLIGKVNTALEIAYALAVIAQLAGVTVHPLPVSSAASLVAISVIASAVGYVVTGMNELRGSQAA